MTGRPSDYTMDIAVDICSRLAQGEPLTKICRDEDKPHVSTVYRWIAALPDFRDMYARAREDQADTLADEIIAISDDGGNDTYETEDGKVLTNQDIVARSRLRVDARKWVAAKLKPKKYGDKIETEHSGWVGFKKVRTGVPDA
jgi:hypothetical protein